MKKLIFALALSVVLLLAIASVASADHGPHGRFNGSTDACASCHRAHSAISTDGFLLVASDVYELCTSCHDGTGAVTNVVDGFYDTSAHAGKTVPVAEGGADFGLYGGGFVNARMLTDYGNTANQKATTNVGAANINTSTSAWAVKNAYDTTATAPVGRAVTSAHNVGQPVGAIGATRTDTVWGAGNINATTGTFAGEWNDGATTKTLALECTSCHTPHGAGGKKLGSATGVPMPSYRLLEFTPVGSNGFEVSGQVATTGYWDTDMNWSATGGTVNTATGLSLAGNPAVPSALGVYVPDVSVKWYTPNFDIASDPSVIAYRGGYTYVTASGTQTSSDMMSAMFAGIGDYGGRYWAYRRPAVTAGLSTRVSGLNTTATILSCVDGSGNPTVTPTACTLPTVSATNPNYDNTPAHDVLGFWCATCHDRYLAPGGASRTTDTNDPGYHLRHRAQGTGTSIGVGTYTCVDCHNAHGTAAQASTLAGTAGYPWGADPITADPEYAAGTAGSSWAGGSTLLKADNRAICLRCHASAVNFFNELTTSTAKMPIFVKP